MKDFLYDTSVLILLVALPLLATWMVSAVFRALFWIVFYMLGFVIHGYIEWDYPALYNLPHDDME